MADSTQTLQRSIWQRLFGKPATGLPSDPGCWAYHDGAITVDLSRAPEFASPGGAIRLEGKGCPERVLVVHGDDGRYYAFRNKCTHGGRRLDPVPGAETVQCCSLGKSTFDYNGRLLAGSAKENILPYACEVREDGLVVTLS